MSKQFWVVCALVVLALVGVFAFTGKKSTLGSSGSAKPTSHILGSGAKHVTLVEYGDFQCPFCGQYYPTLRTVTETYKQDIFFQFRHFPLTSLHQNAFAASRAAEAAGKQGKFFEMYDTLYQNQQSWSAVNAPQSAFQDYAGQLKLDAAKFKTDYESSAVNDAINADMNEGNRLGITGTPTFFLDGKEVKVNNTVEAFKKVIDAEIAKKNPSATGATSATPAPGSTAPETVAPPTTAPATSTSGQ